MRQTLDAGRLPAIRFKPDLQTRPGCCRFVEIPQGGEESQIVGKKVFGPTHLGTAFFQVMPLSGPDNMHLGASLGGRVGGRGVKLRRTSRKSDILYLLVGTPKITRPRRNSGFPGGLSVSLGTCTHRDVIIRSQTAA